MNTKQVPYTFEKVSHRTPARVLNLNTKYHKRSNTKAVSNNLVSEKNKSH